LGTAGSREDRASAEGLARTDALVFYAVTDAKQSPSERFVAFGPEQARRAAELERRAAELEPIQGVHPIRWFFVWTWRTMRGQATDDLRRRTMRGQADDLRWRTWKQQADDLRKLWYGSRSG